MFNLPKPRHILWQWDDLMARIYHQKNDISYHEVVGPSFLDLQKQILNLSSLGIGMIPASRGVDMYCALLGSLGKHFFSAWHLWKWNSRSPNQRINYPSVLEIHLPTFPLPILNVIVLYLFDYLFLMEEKAESGTNEKLHLPKEAVFQVNSEIISKMETCHGLFILSLERKWNWNTRTT